MSLSEWLYFLGAVAVVLIVLEIVGKGASLVFSLLFWQVMRLWHWFHTYPDD